MKSKICKLGGVFLILFLVLLVSQVSAITASIGNARMVLRAETGDTIDKYILVKNVNNVSVDILLTASGDLEKYIDIKDDKFTLAPGEEKKAYFTVKVREEGTTESKINVQFTPQDGKNGVGLSSTIIVIAEKGDSLWDWEDEEENNNENDNTDNGVNVITGATISGNKVSSSIIILLVITGIIFLIFIVLLVIAYKKTKNKGKKENITKSTKPKRSVKKRG